MLALNFYQKHQFIIKTYQNSIFFNRKTHILDQLYRTPPNNTPVGVLRCQAYAFSAGERLWVRWELVSWNDLWFTPRILLSAVCQTSRPPPRHCQSRSCSCVCVLLGTKGFLGRNFPKARREPTTRCRRPTQEANLVADHGFFSLRHKVILLA
jgi:hypothetical protein